MKYIGGESEARDGGLYSYITDSGRSSLRLILRSGLMGKKFLLPDYLCKTVLNVFDELKVDYGFFKIKRDMSIDWSTVNNKRFDILYIINYLGKRCDIEKFKAKRNAVVIEDSVFSPVLQKPQSISVWAGFNSFRKISPLADGSIVKSTFKLRGDSDKR